ncbi:hypothetical protein [Nonomuraea sp. CA-141351]
MDLAALVPGVTRSGRTAFDAETMMATYTILRLIVALTQTGP